MGWRDYHLHAFRFEDPDNGEPIQIGIPDDEESSDSIPILPGWEIPIASYLSEPGQTVNYEYDFGDGWNHQVLLREIVPRQSDTKRPICMAGELACPPEDCGGIWGYQTLLEVISDATHEEHDDMLRWLGGKFDREGFDAESVEFDDPRERWKRAFAERDQVLRRPGGR